jgi:predicted O-methyltransferase YrrM
MPLSALTVPTFDPTAIFEIYRGSYGSELLSAAVAHLRVFSHFHAGPLPPDQLRQHLGLAERPFVVLLTTLRSFGLLVADDAGRLDLTDLAREHLTGGPFDVGDYLGLAADSPGVLSMVERLRSNRPAQARPDDAGAAFIYREGLDSAMEQEAQARRLTLALAGRARNVAPVLAQRVDLADARVLLDVGGGTGIYSIAFLQKHARLRAVVWDRPEVLKVAREMAEAYGVADRLTCRPGDMFVDEPDGAADVVLLSNILHDWDAPECQALVKRCVSFLTPGGRLLIHDVFLNDALDGPAALALYSAALFTLTEGRAYSAAEYRAWLSGAGLTAGPVTPTLIHCGVLIGRAPS